MTSRRGAIVAIVSLAVLVAVVAGAWIATHRAPAAAEAKVTYICPMHPEIVADRPGSCPICGMDLVPAGSDQGAHESGESHDAEPESAADRSPVRLSDAKLRRIGARSELVARAPFLRSVRAAGTVAVDDTRRREVQTKTSGWVERLWANAEGERVERGRPLLEIYSPELLAAQNEFLVARRAREQLRSSPLPEVAGSADALVESARARLRLLDLTDAQIAEIERSGSARRTIVVASPISGTILRRDVAQGSGVAPGTPLLEVADLARVWVLAGVFEYELPYVREGQEAEVVLPYLPGRVFRGRVDRVYPTLDPATRTARVRIVVANDDGTLRPDMFAEVAITADLGLRLSVPTAAVLETGTRSVVFVDEGDGVFAPRTIEAGLRLPDRVEVLAGLAEGERILASGNFFVDSESRLRASLEAASGHRH